MSEVRKYLANFGLLGLRRVHVGNLVDEAYVARARNALKFERLPSRPLKGVSPAFVSTADYRSVWCDGTWSARLEVAITCSFAAEALQSWRDIEEVIYSILRMPVKVRGEHSDLDKAFDPLRDLFGMSTMRRGAWNEGSRKLLVPGRRLLRVSIRGEGHWEALRPPSDTYGRLSTYSCAHYWLRRLPTPTRVWVTYEPVDGAPSADVASFQVQRVYHSREVLAQFAREVHRKRHNFSESARDELVRVVSDSWRLVHADSRRMSDSLGARACSLLWDKVDVAEHSEMQALRNLLIRNGWPHNAVRNLVNNLTNPERVFAQQQVNRGHSRRDSLAPEQRIINLLANSFEREEVVSILRSLPPGYRELVWQLPSSPASSLAVAEAAVTGLLRHDAVDESFFQLLETYRPTRALEIHQIMADWFGAKADR